MYAYNSRIRAEFSDQKNHIFRAQEIASGGHGVARPSSRQKPEIPISLRETTPREMMPLHEKAPSSFFIFEFGSVETDDERGVRKSNGPLCMRLFPRHCRYVGGAEQLA
jgi:hypothetical protein